MPIFNQNLSEGFFASKKVSKENFESKGDYINYENTNFTRSYES